VRNTSGKDNDAATIKLEKTERLMRYKVGFRPEMALARLQLGELQPQEATSLYQIQQAVVELRSLGMRPGLRRGLEVLWQWQARIAREAQEQHRNDVAESASVTARAAVEELIELQSDASAGQAPRRAARRNIPIL
jgi:hypothetical protein